MARPREFNTDKALNDALNTFWMLGYEAASLPDLLKGMGLTRGSFYKAFSDKKSLFLQIMEQYDKEAVEPAIELLTNRNIPDGTKRIEKLFRSILKAVKNGDRRGCLLCSTVAASSTLDTEISDRAEKLLGKLGKAFETALKDSAFEGEQKKPAANLLLTQYVGLRILARSGSPVRRLENSVNALCKYLER